MACIYLTVNTWIHNQMIGGLVDVNVRWRFFSSGVSKSVQILQSACSGKAEVDLVFKVLRDDLNSVKDEDHDFLP